MKKVKQGCNSMLAARIETGCLCIPLTIEFVRTLRRLSGTVKGLQLQDKLTHGIVHTFTICWLRDTKVKGKYNLISDKKLFNLPEWVQLCHPGTLYVTEHSFVIRSEYGISEEIPINEFSY